MAARAPELTRRPAGRPRPAPRRPGIAALRRVPAAAWVCALVALLNATAWSLLTPAFQVPDEQSHYAYTEYLVQHGRPPVSAPTNLYSGSEEAAMQDLRFGPMRFVPGNVGVWSRLEQATLQHDLQTQRDRSGGNGAAREVGGEPPLYYALEAVPYRLAAGGTVLDRLQLMRLGSALLAGCTVLFVFLFLRELLPDSPWSWTVGALGVAFQPLFGFISAGVNSDALLYATSAAVFFLLARAFRRGLTPRLAVALGAALAAGLLTKFNMMGLVPGVALGLLAVAARQEGRLSMRTLRLPALALAVAAAPLLLESLLNATAWGRPAVDAFATRNFGLRADVRPTVLGGLSYAWQFYFIPLPGQPAPLGGLPLWEEWFTGFVGLLGWIDTVFRPWVYRAALVPTGLVAALALATLVRGRKALARRRVELLVYTSMATVFALFVAAASYVTYLRYHENIAQARYLLPLVSLYAAALALATRGLGRRWAPVVGCAIVSLAIAHDVFSQLLVISRYYA
jgi:4-amino-4-deoxy-L-arabinose transferase-like glycosyltransferase